MSGEKQTPTSGKRAGDWQTQVARCGTPATPTGEDLAPAGRWLAETNTA